MTTHPMKSHVHHTETPPHEGNKEEKVSFSPILPPEKLEPSDHGDLKTLIEKNIKWSQVIYNQNRKIQRRLSWIVFGSYLRLFLILVPVILGIIYLPPLIADAWTQYGSAFGGSGQTFQDYLDLFKSSR